MERLRQRLRNAVVVISRTPDSELSTLSPLQRSLLPILTFASWFYGGIVHLRAHLYSLGFLSKTRLSVPVISVGNITWGGSGKTPMVEYLAWCFLRAGIRPLILSRGYRGGDEVQMLKAHLQPSSAVIGVGANRARVAQGILKDEGTMGYQVMQSCVRFLNGTFKSKVIPAPTKGIGVAILDDGFQHMVLQRDLEVVMVNALTFLGNGRMIPRGPLREAVGSLRRANVIVIHHADLVTEKRLLCIKDVLSQAVSTEAVYIYSKMTPHNFLKPHSSQTGTEKISLDKVRGYVLLCVTGIACPESLSLQLKELGHYHVERLDFEDHYMFQSMDLARVEVKVLELKEKFGRGVYVLISEKDYNRNPDVWSEVNTFDVLILHSSLEILECRGMSSKFNQLLANAINNCRQVAGLRWYGNHCAKIIFIKNLFFSAGWQRIRASSGQGSPVWKNKKLRAFRLQWRCFQSHR